jgi:hypothetical protein
VSKESGPVNLSNIIKETIVPNTKQFKKRLQEVFSDKSEEAKAVNIDEGYHSFPSTNPSGSPLNESVQISNIYIEDGACPMIYNNLSCPELYDMSWPSIEPFEEIKDSSGDVEGMECKVHEERPPYEDGWMHMMNLEDQLYKSEAFRQDSNFHEEYFDHDEILSSYVKASIGDLSLKSDC